METWPRLTPTAALALDGDGMNGEDLSSGQGTIVVRYSTDDTWRPSDKESLDTS